MKNIPKNVRISPFETHKQYDFITGRGEDQHQDDPGEVIGPLIREFYALKYCKSGRGTLIVNDETFSVRPGQCYVLLPGDIVTEIADENDPWCYAYIVFIGSRAGMFFHQLGISSATPLFPWSENASFLACLETIGRACLNPWILSEPKRIAYAYLILDELSSYYNGNLPNAMSIAESYVDSALIFMEENLSQSITVADVAAHLGLNRSYFASIFKRQMQITPQDYLVRLRISRACELFAFPHATVASVANSLNYDPSVFFRHFKRIVGISPSEYKRRLNETHRIF